MAFRTSGLKSSRLAAALPGHAFHEWHCDVADAPIEAVWDAIHRVRWSDLASTKPLLRARGIGPRSGLEVGVLDQFARRSAVEEHAPYETVFAMIGKPWKPLPPTIAVSTLAEVTAFDEPGWLKYGMEWRLAELPDGRTFVETSTLCEPTDASARRRFRAYWVLIRAGSGLIRRDLLRAVREACDPSNSAPTAGIADTIGSGTTR